MCPIPWGCADRAGCWGHLGAATLTMIGRASVVGNTAMSGGGIYNEVGTLVGATGSTNVVSNHPEDIAP
jgi:hypothetical protein